MKPRPLSWDNKAKQYVKAKAYFKDLDGKKKAQRFWLGSDAEQAKVKAAAIEASWAVLEAQGYTYWTHEALYDLQERDIVKFRTERLRPRVPRVPKASTITTRINVTALKKEEAVQGWLDTNGDIRPECLVQFQKYAVSQLVATDKNTQQLIESVQELWTNDPLGTLERISKLGIAPNQVNVGIGTPMSGGINVFLSDDAATDPPALPPGTATIIDAGEPMAAAKKKWKWGEIDPATGRRQYPLHKAQHDVLNSTARFTFAFAGTGGGKTVLIPLRLMKQIQDDLNAAKRDNRDLIIDPLKYLIIVPTYGMLKKTGLLDQLDAVFQNTPYEGTFNKQEHFYPIGKNSEYGTIFIASAENPKAIEGGKYDALYLDEAAKIGYEAWRNGKARVGHKNAPIFGVTTPDINNWIYTEIFNSCDKTTMLPVGGEASEFFKRIGYDLSQYNVERRSSAGDYYCRQWSSAQNNTYQISAIENSYKTLNKGEFERRYLGSFSRIDGLVYETFADHVLTVEPTADEFRKHPAVRVAASIDWGFDPDPAAITVGIECQDNRLYIVDEVYANRLSYDELARHCHRLKDKWGIQVFYCDSSGKAAINELCIRGVNATKRTIPDIQLGCQMVNARLRTDLLKIHSNCTNLIDEASRYARPTDGDGDLKNKPIDKHNHALDALRYLITGMDYGRPLASYKAHDLLTDEERKDKELQREILLGRVSPDPDERRKLEVEAAMKAKEQWFNQMVLLGTD